MFWHDEEESFTEEEPVQRRRDWRLVRRLAPYFKKYIRRIVVAALLLLITTLLTLFGPVLIKHAIDIEFPNKDLHGLFVIAILYFLIQLIIIVVRYFQQIEIMTVGEKAIADLKADLFTHMLSLPAQFFDKNPVGRLITRVEGDTETLKNLFSSTAVVLVQDLALLVGMSVVMILVNYRLYLIILIMLPLFVYGFWWFGRNVRPVYLGLRRTIAEINSFLVESVRGLSVIQSFLQEDTFIKKINDLGKKKFQQEMKAMSFWYRIWFLVDIGEVMGIILIIGIGGLWALKGLVSLGSLFLFLSYIVRFFGPLRGLSDQMNIIERAFASAERVFGILSTQSETSFEEQRSLTTFQQKIEFEGVNFFYEDGNWVLKDLNFTIRKGERIALVGETGGGKTSIISLLLKFYKPQKGKIIVDDWDAEEIDRKSLRSRMGLVPQDVILFPGSIMENLRLFDQNIPEGRVFEAASRTKIHDRILKFPQGYNTNLIEQGINLSFGERQLVSFTRALVFDPEILILDEATSSVDPQSERLIQDGMKELLRDRTAIIIAHRLATTRLANKILVIHNGQLIEEGNHSSLLKKKGFYYKLYRLQYLAEVK